MSRNKKTVLALVAFLGIGALAWAMLPAGPDPQLVKVQQMQAKLFNPDVKLTDEERRASFGELRQEVEKLAPEQRDELMRNNPMAQQFRERLVTFFDLSEKERKARLDEDIDRMEKFRKEREKQRGNGGDRPPGGFGNRGNMDQNQQNAMRKRMLDHTSPQERAMFGEYMSAMQQRRKERGLPPMGGPFGR